MSKGRNESRRRQGDDQPDLGLRPLTARSVMLSTLLGTHPPRMPVRALIRVGELFDIPEGTVRVALSRMAADGDITASDGTYSLGERLSSRAARQDESRSPGLRRWNGQWAMAVVTASGRSPAERATLRREMVALRLAEQREGVWLRPANLWRARPPSPGLASQCAWYEVRPEADPALLARSLWDLDAWADRARRLHTALARALSPPATTPATSSGPAGSLAHGFVVSAAVLRHLLSDPLLPEPLLPADWPGRELREQYERFDAAYRARLRDYTRASIGPPQSSVARHSGVAQLDTSS